MLQRWPYVHICRGSTKQSQEVSKQRIWSWDDKGGRKIKHILEERDCGLDLIKILNIHVWHSQRVNKIFKKPPRIQCREGKVCCYLAIRDPMQRRGGVLLSSSLQNHDLSQSIWGLMRTHKMCVSSVPSVKGISINWAAEIHTWNTCKRNEDAS